MWKSIQQRLVDESGPTSVEYAVMLALILIVCIASIFAVGTINSGIWSSDESRIRSGVS